MATLHHTVSGTFFFKNRPHTGTSTTYSAVMNPALPTVVLETPICCKLAATHRASPHSSPPRSSIFLSCGAMGSFLFRFRTAMTGTSAALPSKLRTAVNVNGPTRSMATLCATKAKPQIMAASSSRALPRDCFVLIFPSPHILPATDSGRIFSVPSLPRRTGAHSPGPAAGSGHG